MGEAMANDERGALGLDQPGSAGAGTLHRAWLFAASVAAIVVGVLVSGRQPLMAIPEFVDFHASLIFVLDGVTAFLLYGQFVYRRRWSYAVLASGYLYSALMAIPFLITFPGALMYEGPLIGGSQSAIWVWHLWNALFPLFVMAALLIDSRFGWEVAYEKLTRSITLSVVFTTTLVALITVLVARFHHLLPVLITAGPAPLTANFYAVGWTTAGIVALALIVVARRARDGSILHVWLSMVLIACLAGAVISLGSSARYTVAWYAGRLESMFAASVLLLVLLNELNRLYHRLGDVNEELSRANGMLSSLLDQQESLVMQLKRSEEQVRQMAYHDAVTGLPNRRFAMDRMNHEMKQAARYGHGVAVLFIDVDLFKEINDRFGHEAGDELLREIGSKLSACVRRGDTVARFGGDEFMIMLPEIAAQEDATAVARKLVDNFRTPVAVLGHSIPVTTSIGIATCSGATCGSAEELVRRADAAMYDAKKAGRNRFSFG